MQLRARESGKRRTDNWQAVGITSAGEKGGVSVITKKQKSTQTPAKSIVKHTYGGKSQRK